MKEYTLSLKVKGSKKKAATVTLDEEMVEEIYEAAEGDCHTAEAVRELIKAAGAQPLKPYRVCYDYVDVEARDDDHATEIAEELHPNLGITDVEEV
jgi:hypothetical protein